MTKLTIEALGIPQENIFLEDQALHTLENVLYTRDLIEQYIGFQSISSVTAIMQSFHARRVLMTMNRHFPEHIEVKAAPYVPASGITRENWHTTTQGHADVSSEVKKIETYLLQDDIAEL